MSHIDQLLAEQCPYGVSKKPLREVCSDFIVPMRDRPKVFDGNIPWCRIEDIEGKTLNDSKSDLRVSEQVVRDMNLKVMPAGTVIATCSASLGTYAITTQPLVTNQTFIGLVCGDGLYNRFLMYLLHTKTEALTAASNSGTIAYIPRKKFEELSIPVPPLEVQREIVRILDQFTHLEAELEAELEARRQQYDHYQRSLLRLNEGSAAWMTLGDIGKVSMCKRVFKNETASEGDIPFFKIGTFGGLPDAFISRELYESYRTRYSFPNTGDVLISAAGTIGRTISYDGEPAYFQDSNIVWINNDETIVLNSYLRHWYQVIEWATDGGTIRRLYNENIRRARIAVPPLEEQKRIAAILDKFDALVNDLSIGLPAELAARRKQYEYYRDQLLTFEEAPA